jgi:hypothetical protein
MKQIIKDHLNVVFSPILMGTRIPIQDPMGNMATLLLQAEVGEVLTVVIRLGLTTWEIPTL